MEYFGNKVSITNNINLFCDKRQDLGLAGFCLKIHASLFTENGDVGIRHLLEHLILRKVDNSAVGVWNAETNLNNFSFYFIGNLDDLVMEYKKLLSCIFNFDCVKTEMLKELQTIDEEYQQSKLSFEKNFIMESLKNAFDYDFNVIGNPSLLAEKIKKQDQIITNYVNTSIISDNRKINIYVVGNMSDNMICDLVSETQMYSEKRKIARDSVDNGILKFTSKCKEISNLNDNKYISIMWKVNNYNKLDNKFIATSLLLGSIELDNNHNFLKELKEAVNDIYFVKTIPRIINDELYLQIITATKADKVNCTINKIISLINNLENKSKAELKELYRQVYFYRFYTLDGVINSVETFLKSSDDEEQNLILAKELSNHDIRNYHLLCGTKLTKDDCSIFIA